MYKKETISWSKLFWYTVIFSVVGLFVETTYAYITTGILESRKGLLMGPFCPIYGIGATVLILATYYFNDSNIKIFFIGTIFGAIVEYVLSFALEAIYGIRFWEYSYMNYNLNGRICIIYSFFWGVLSVVLIKFIKPRIDKLIDKIPKKNVVESVLFFFLLFDVLITIWAVKTYQKRVVFHNVSNGIKGKIEEKFFSNEIMVKNFPNLRYRTADGKEIFIKNLL